MTFGPFPEDHCFRIEISPLYERIQQGLKTAEFLLLKPGEPPAIWIVEAKSSSPQPKTQPHFDEYIRDIEEKLSNSLSLGIAAHVGRHSEKLPAPFQSVDLSSMLVRLVLIVKGHKDEWLPPLQDALRKALATTSKTWALDAKAVIVLNEGLAAKYELIQKDQATPPVGGGE